MTTIIETITQADFEAQDRGGLGRPRSLESISIRSLTPGSGIRYPCHWIHNNAQGCPGAGQAHLTAKKAGFRIRTHCRGGFLHVFRYE